MTLWELSLMLMVLQCFKMTECRDRKPTVTANVAKTPTIAPVHVQYTREVLGF